MTDVPVVEAAAPVNEASKTDGPRSTDPKDQVAEVAPEAVAGQGPETDEEEEVETEVETGETPAKPKKKRTLQGRFNEVTAEKYALQSERDRLARELEEVRKPKAPAPVQTQADDRIFDETGAEITLEGCDFDSSLYQRKLAKAEARNLLESERKAAKQQEVVKGWEDRLATFSVDRPDSREVIFKNPLAEFYPQDMQEYLIESDMGPALAYHLGQNLNVTDALIRMEPRPRDRALAKLEASLEAKPAAATPRTFTQAPAPVKSLTGSGHLEKTPDEMTMAEYSAWRKRTTSAKR